MAERAFGGFFIGLRFPLSRLCPGMTTSAGGYVLARRIPAWLAAGLSKVRVSLQPAKRPP